MFLHNSCDEEGYDVAPLGMVQSKLNLEHTTSGNENEKCKLPCATNMLLREHATSQKTGDTRGQMLQHKDKPSIAAILQIKENSMFLHPFILVVVETLDSNTSQVGSMFKYHWP